MMDQTDNIAAFEIPADGQDRLIIGDFDFKLIEDACNWGTGGLVNISAITADIDHAVNSTLLYRGKYHNDGELKIMFKCIYSYPEGVSNQEFNFVNGTQPHSYEAISVVGAQRLAFHGKATLLDGWICLNGLLRDSSDENRCWPILLVRKRTPDNFDWSRYEFSLEEAMQINPSLVGRISIRNYEGTTLPAKFWEFKQLKSLDIYGAANLQELSEEIGDFTQLRHLTISHTPLEKLPQGIFQLPNLETLYIADNRLRHVAESLYLPKLQAANFGGNQLTTLPKSLTKSTKLWRIVLENNPWISLPAPLGEIKTVELNIDEKKRLLEHAYKGADGKGLAAWDEDMFLIKNDAELHSVMIDAIKDTLYEDHVSVLQETALKAVCMRTVPMGDYSTLGNTRFGGLPDLPADAEYPTYTHIYRRVGHNHHIFIAQLNCAELAPFQNYLPREGILYFYLEDLEEFECKVVYHPTTQLLQSAKSLIFEPFFNNPYLSEPSKPVEVEYTQLIALPSRLNDKHIHEYADELADGKFDNHMAKLGQTFSESIGRMGVLMEHRNHYYSYMNHSINDHPYYEFESPSLLAALDRKGNPEDWMVLLRVYSDNKCGFDYFDGRELCFMIHKSDLVKRDFSNVFAAAGF